MDFNILPTGSMEGFTINPYGAKTDNGWVETLISIDWLNEHFGEFGAAEEMKNNTESKGLKLFFDYLVDEGHLDE